MASSLLDNAVSEVYLHFLDRYDLKLKPGKAELTSNEIAGIISRNLNLQPSQTTTITVQVKADFSDFDKKLAEAIRKMQRLNALHDRSR